MNSDLFVIEVTAWTVSLTPNAAVSEIGGIVKFLNFKPFEFFRRVNASGENGKNNVFNIRKSKSALFRFEAQELQSQLATTPLYVVIAQWSGEDENIEHGQRLIGVATISLTKLGSFRSPEMGNPNGAEIRTLSGIFPIRDLSGKAVGQIHLRVQLTEMNCPQPPTVDPRADCTMDHRCSKQPDMAALTSSSPTNHNRTQMFQPSLSVSDQAVQYDPPQCGCAIYASNQNEINNSLETVAPSFIPHRKVKAAGNLTEQQTKSWTTAEEQCANIVDKSNSETEVFPDCSEETSVHCQTAYIPKTETLHSIIKHRVSSKPLPRRVYQAKPLEKKNPSHLSSVTPQSSTSSLLSKNDECCNYREISELPVLRSLIKELQMLRMNPCPENLAIKESELERVLSILSANSSRQKLDAQHKRNGSHFCTRQAAPSVQNADIPEGFLQRKLVNAIDRRNKLHLMAQPRKRLPPPGGRVPKDRGWLRSTPIYRGNSHSSITPRLNHAHLLRLQQARSKDIAQKRFYYQCDSRSHPSNRCPPQTPQVKTSESQTEQSNKPEQPASTFLKIHGKHRQSQQEPTREIQSLHPNSLSRPQLSEVSNSDRYRIPNSQLAESPVQGDRGDTPTCVSLAISTNSSTLSHSPRAYSHDSRNCKSHIPETVSVKSGIGQIDSRFKPQQSELSPQISFNHTKFVGLTQDSPRSSIENVEKLNIVSNTITISNQERFDEVEEVSKVSQINISDKGLRDNQYSSIQSTDNSSDGSEQIQLESQSDQTESRNSQGRNSVTDETQSYSEDYTDSSDESDNPNLLSHNIAPMDLQQISNETTGHNQTALTSKVHTATDHLSSNIADTRQGSDSFDATSFTRVTTQMDRGVTYHTEDGSIECSVLQSQNPEKLNEMNDKKTTIPRKVDFECPTFNDMRKQDTDSPDEIDIEAMRSRGSHDYIFGGLQTL